MCCAFWHPWIRKFGFSFCSRKKNRQWRAFGAFNSSWWLFQVSLLFSFLLTLNLVTSPVRERELVWFLWCIMLLERERALSWVQVRACLCFKFKPLHDPLLLAHNIYTLFISLRWLQCMSSIIHEATWLFIPFGWVKGICISAIPLTGWPPLCAQTHILLSFFFFLYNDLQDRILFFFGHLLSFCTV